MTKQRVTTVLATAGLILGAASAALAGSFLKDAVTECSLDARECPPDARVSGTACPPDARLSGTACMDTFEASVWRIPLRARNKELIMKVREGEATVAQLRAAGATRLGVASTDYAPPCTGHGSGCTDIFAVSVRGVIPSSHITWFQAQQACKNSRKRLPSNAEWQAAVAGSPDPGPDNGTTDCNTNSTQAVTPTGRRSSCRSADGNFDMVGNLIEWVADWVPRSNECGVWSFSNDFQCFAGAATTTTPPPTPFPGELGALLRGGNFSTNPMTGNGGVFAGPLEISGFAGPSTASDSIGFRCAR